MRRAKGIHDIDIAQCRHFPGQVFVVLLFAFVETNVFTKHHLTRGRVHSIQPVLGQFDGASQQFRQTIGDGFQGKLFGVFALGGTAEVGHQQNLGAGLEAMLDGGQAGPDAGIAGHFAILDRHIQIFANQYALAGKIEFSQSLEAHGSFPG